MDMTNKRFNNIRVEHGTQLPFTSEEPFHIVFENTETKEKSVVPVSWTMLNGANVVLQEAVDATNKAVAEQAERLKTTAPTVQPTRNIGARRGYGV